jgi:RNA polymerase sigma-B factor
LAHLEKRTREILEFVFLHDLTQKEVAEILDISVVTVSRRLKKGLDALKNLMTGAER